MTRYRIDKSPTAVAIQLTQVGGQQQQLMEAFQDCAEGRCSCPTNEYKNVASMEIASDDDRIKISLEAKPGTDLHVSEIAKCLDHTLTALDGSRPRSASSVARR